MEVQFQIEYLCAIGEVITIAIPSLHQPWGNLSLVESQLISLEIEATPEMLLEIKTLFKKLGVPLIIDGKAINFIDPNLTISLQPIPLEVRVQFKFIQQEE